MNQNNSQETELSGPQADRDQPGFEQDGNELFCAYHCTFKQMVLLALKSSTVPAILSTSPAPGDFSDVAPEKDNLPRELASGTSSASSNVMEKGKSRKKKKDTFEKKQIRPVLRYIYNEDQWSPLNPEGKKQYDRNYLLQLRYQSSALHKPSNLPKLDVIKDKPYEVNSVALNSDGKGFQSRSRGRSRRTKAPKDSDVKTSLMDRY
ncbi:eukaryotic translation initiation factor 4 gamma 3 [Trichonephila inaurata madagascariensis]|uniref:Eukaryotic translation initiation factor 4 gamma 3 n=1 Tax=Trichonephila inaurata madagascariensis TaxID=2747483 RepID=A0A8X6YNR1_9ARAC|nr:eukaryotic translation initiation factor 4 gamma 3 [Trichonephila inaurata madagascariensis]